MSSSTLSRAIAKTIFTILVCYALWESHAPHKKKQRLRRQVCTDSFLPRLFLIGDYNNQLPSNLGKWRDDEDEEQIWGYLDKVLRDAGFTLWTHAYFSVFSSPGRTYPLSSGFGYAIPTRIELNQIGTVGRLRQFQFPVCWFCLSILTVV